MATTKNTAVRVRSVIYDLDESGKPVGEAEITEISADGKLSERDGVARISYAECGEGERVDCELLINKSFIRLKRRGAVLLDLELREGEITRTVYSVPPYKFDMAVRTKRAISHITDSGADIELEYDMSVGGAERRASMTVSAKAN